MNIKIFFFYRTAPSPPQPPPSQTLIKTESKNDNSITTNGAHIKKEEAEKVTMSVEVITENHLDNAEEDHVAEEEEHKTTVDNMEDEVNTSDHKPLIAREDIVAHV